MIKEKLVQLDFSIIYYHTYCGYQIIPQHPVYDSIISTLIAHREFLKFSAGLRSPGRGRNPGETPRVVIETWVILRVAISIETLIETLIATLIESLITTTVQ